MTWRSTIKAKARQVVPRFYDIGPHRPAEENQIEAEELINEALFLRDGVDDEVRVVFSAPAF